MSVRLVVLSLMVRFLLYILLGITSLVLFVTLSFCFLACLCATVFTRVVTLLTHFSPIIAIKPDGVQRNLVGKIIQRFEEKGFKLVALKMIHPSEAMAAGHYDDLKKKPVSVPFDRVD